MIHVCLTHDVDRTARTYQYVTRTIKYFCKGQVVRALKSILLLRRSPSSYWGFDSVMDIENHFHVKSTFFFLDESVRIKCFSPQSYKLACGRYRVDEPRISAMMQFLDQNGWEVGVHGSYYSYNNKDLLKREKQHIERILGHTVWGIRQHYLNWSENTWSIHADLGFEYDSTWGFTRDIGFKEEHITPFFPITNSTFVEIPMTIMDSCFQNKADKWKILEDIIRDIDENDAYLVINFHTNNFNEIDFPHYKENYIQLIELLKKRGADFLTMHEACQQWKISHA